MFGRHDTMAATRAVCLSQEILESLRSGENKAVGCEG
jgi:hypothetical protein